jgi:hypothetical protein
VRWKEPVIFMESEIDPQTAAQDALFSIIRVWAADFPEVDQEKITGRCLEIMSRANEVPGASFVFVCELARMVVGVITRYLCVCYDRFPDAGEVLAEIESLELDYIEELVVAEGVSGE